MDFWRDFPGPNAAYMLDLYDRYKKDPGAVDKETRAFFDQYPLEDGQIAAPEIAGVAIDQIVGAANLARSIREFGYLDAQLDPLGNPSPGDPSLRLELHDLTEDGLRSLPASLIGGPIVSSAATALDAIQALRQIYSGTLGHDHGQVRVPQEREWLRDAAESRRFSLQANPVDPKTLLERLTQVEVFEQFLHRIFPGKHRFSIEGLDSMVPMLDEIICGAAESGIRNVLIGMAHRGRLNFLAHVLQKS
jgi:2-oxoglutarate dehydrogenase E1 component